MATLTKVTRVDNGTNTLVNLDQVLFIEHIAPVDAKDAVLGIKGQPAQPANKTTGTPAVLAVEHQSAAPEVKAQPATSRIHFVSDHIEPLHVKEVTF